MYILLNNISAVVSSKFNRVAVNTFTVLCVCDMPLVLLQSKCKMLVSDGQISSGVLSLVRRQTLTSVTRFTMCVW